MNLCDGAAGFSAATDGVLAEGFGPKTVAVAVATFADKSDVAAAGDFLFDAAKVGAEFEISGDAQFSVLKGCAEAIGHFFLKGGGEGDWFDFPAKAFPGCFGHLHSQPTVIDA